MPDERHAVQLAVLENNMQSVLASLLEASTSRKANDEHIQNLLLTVTKMDARLQAVEKQLATNAPTIEEFITIKHQVKGAGVFGKAAWAAGAVIIALIYSSREAIRSFFAG